MGQSEMKTLIRALYRLLLLLLLQQNRWKPPASTKTPKTLCRTTPQTGKNSRLRGLAPAASALEGVAAPGPVTPAEVAAEASPKVEAEVPIGVGVGAIAVGVGVEVGAGVEVRAPQKNRKSVEMKMKLTLEMTEKTMRNFLKVPRVLMKIIKRVKRRWTCLPTVICFRRTSFLTGSAIFFQVA